MIPREEALRWTWHGDLGMEGAEDSVDEMVRDGRILEQNGLLTLPGMGHLFGLSRERMLAAERRLEYGKQFLASVTRLCPEILMSGISGSVSYGAAGKEDDVDILLVTRTGTLWSVLRKVLLQARMLRREGSGSPTLCLSYCVDEDTFRREAREHRSRLFARDFLRLKTVTGVAFYSKVMSECRWIRNFYPIVYDEKISASNEYEQPDLQSTVSRNKINYLAVGGYLKLAAAFRNLRFRIKGQESRRFRAIIGENRCIYESVKWKRLEDSFERVGTSFE